MKQEVNNEEHPPTYTFEQPETNQVISFHWVLEPLGPPKNMHGLALGNYEFAKNNACLQQHQITAVISVFGQSEIKFQSKISHFRILIGDNPSENIKCFFDSANKFISEHIKTTNVLVHCKAGVSRSATIVAAYLMKTKQMGYSQAVKFIRGKRAIVDPNRGFVKQLRQYQRQLKQQREKQTCLCY